MNSSDPRLTLYQLELANRLLEKVSQSFTKAFGENMKQAQMGLLDFADAVRDLATPEMMARAGLHLHGREIAFLLWLTEQSEEVREAARRILRDEQSD